VSTMPSVASTCSEDIAIFQRVEKATSAATSVPRVMPTAQPPTARNVASIKNWRRISLGLAPTAIRNPISPVLSFTDMSISARIPAPPTKREIAARLVASRLSDSATCF
jgi:hypothetical protein